MAFFSMLYNWLYPSVVPNVPHYGRAVHSLPNPDEHELFEKASETFIKGNRIKGYDFFLSSLTHIGTSKHLTYTVFEDKITFELLQGCAIIRGTVTEEALIATAVIAKSSDLHVALKRRFLERNFQLTYARFCDNDGVLTLKLYLDNATITPHKIFFPLREIALNSDFEKEMIWGEFPEISLLENDHVHYLEHEKYTCLHTWMLTWIDQTKKSLQGLLSNDNTGMVSFSYLALLLQIDYLLIPRKKMAKDIAEKVGGYFTDDEKSTEDKNADLQTYLSKLETMNIEDFSSQIYRGEYTFSPFDQVMHEEIVSFIDESLLKVKWYKSNHSSYVIGAIYRYIALYILYNYGLHPTLRALMHLHVQVYASDFFVDMGEMPLYVPHKNQFDKGHIHNLIDSAIIPYQKRYKGLKNFSDLLNYTDLNNFSQSFYLQIKNLDFLES
ncbi:MAG: hypothetical protein Q8J85_04165 [Sulfuricurvum sp.]|nr:hypothetical protein [Sulfuricurvum sp.]MDP3022659.1 hypothetical protein [Sulfuricurvum sp.]